MWPRNREKFKSSSIFTRTKDLEPAVKMLQFQVSSKIPHENSVYAHRKSLVLYHLEHPAVGGRFDLDLEVIEKPMTCIYTRLVRCQ